MKHKLTIRRVEYYSMSVIVEADSKAEAIAILQKKWEKDDSLLYEMTEQADDTSTRFQYGGKASENDINKFPQITK
ncbi:MAG: hypothetical protein IJ584_02720 [Bacteroidales bacterium]|nr:hypothetical protein [Bacteroidales bacterium]